MVVNSSIHALAIQAERGLKRVEAAEATSCAARAELSRSQRDKEALGMVVRHMADLKLDLKHQVEYLQEDIREKTRIFSQVVEEAKVKIIEDYIASSRFDDMMVGSYRWGFKLSRWMIRNTYPELDISAITTSHITQEMAAAADDDPDSEDEAGPSGIIEVPSEGEEDVPPGL
ncbi:PREDICTED: uncharacterized protein LOC104599105 [Nelumbo nucifera]|uniref:Uncharacterized protein LOC104599105 n=1 Tax=Nelumbo nucifera TaxID=4432 RepID=A0A1U8ADE9_NELNU|nr:PREDICTED: uncharacterized protein LOC104599105 [Nelumbo nucifera]